MISSFTGFETTGEQHKLSFTSLLIFDPEKEHEDGKGMACSRTSTRRQISDTFVKFGRAMHKPTDEFEHKSKSSFRIRCSTFLGDSPLH